jgi:hypothetical protein
MKKNSKESQEELKILNRRDELYSNKHNQAPLYVDDQSSIEIAVTSSGHNSPLMLHRNMAMDNNFAEQLMY